MATEKLKVYVVQRFQWEYNDEYHYRADDGEPIKTFRDRTRAEAVSLGEPANDD